MARFHPHPAQLAALEAQRGGRTLLMGMRFGRRYATEMAIISSAATPEDARLLLQDLNRDGIALQTSDGRRVDPKPKPRGRHPRFTYMRFDEEEK